MNKLLEAARRLAEVDPYCDGMLGAYCLYCADDPPAHAPTCSWLSMPKIIAALEAAERIAAWGNIGPYCTGCARRVAVTGAGADLQSHRPDCPWQALVAALAPEAPAP